MKTYLLKNGAFITFEKNAINGFYTVLLRAPNGSVFDRVSCDDYKNALDYKRAFIAIGGKL